MLNLKKLGPYKAAFLLGAVWLVGLTLIFTAMYGKFSAEGFGRFLGMTMLSSAITGFQAKRAKIPWGLLKFGLVYTGILLLAFLVSSYGATSYA